MPKRPLPTDYTFGKPKPVNKILQARVINFLINRKIINRQLKFLNSNVRARAEGSMNGREIDLEIIQGKHVVESYTVDFNGFYKKLLLTYTEVYSTEYMTWMNKWVDHVVAGTPEQIPHMPKEPDTFVVEEYSG